MRGSLGDIEAFVVVAVCLAALYAFVVGLIESNPATALGGLAGYAAVWLYGLVRASYSGPGPA
jgi:hypothetical protein